MLHRSRTNVVFGRGDEKGNYAVPPEEYELRIGKVMFVGDAPGEKEDETGLPFTGHPGDFFEDLMKDPGFPAYFITDAVMCKPPGKDKPKAIHWNACRPRIMEEIRIVDPVVIVAMGATAIKTLIGGTATSVVRARKELHHIDIPGYSTSYIKPVIATYHPASVQRKGQINPGSELEALLKALIEAKTVAKLWAHFGNRRDK